MITIDMMKPQPVLGENCRDLRKDNNISVSDFAKKLGLSRQAVYNFENGKTQSMELLRGYIKLSKGEL